MNNIINGRESSILCLLACSSGISKKDKIRILSALEGRALDIAKTIVGEYVDPPKELQEVAIGFVSWVEGLEK